ncbi:MAG: DUF2062 domain-containing protein [Desulfobulbaceae bacterium]|nr:DUF2062 domain-containing protein [Desulfobulbaceae bacterium]
MNFNRINKYYYLRFKRLRGDPKILAGGTAIGVFIGLTPTIPLHTLMVIAFTLVTRTSTIAGIISSLLVCNPLTYFPIYYFSVSFGNLITPYEINRKWLEMFFDQLIHSGSILDSITLIGTLGYETIIVLITGGILLALPLALASFYLSLYFFRNYSGSHKKKSLKSSSV